MEWIQIFRTFYSVIHTKLVGKICLGFTAEEDDKPPSFP